MDPEAAAVITPHLLAREKLLWCGRPHDTAALLRWRVVAIVLVGIAALALRALPLESSLAERADINSILLAVLVCVLIAEAIVFHTYLSNTFYGVTNQRAIIVSGLREPEMTAVPLDALNTPRLRVLRINRTVELSPPDSRSGALPFTDPSVPPDWTGNEWYRILALEDPRQVYELIVEAASKLK
ncbi:MAG: hypothetical protein WAU82_04420 [Candidatus Binatus sp.]|uniref:hypothetical protein n=1 Tax=Candidatus Binatus sp. TaxID=2811406 RepID=UPI003BAF64C6